MKVALGSLVMILLASASAHAQQIGGSLTPSHSFQVLPWTPPANQQALIVSGTDVTFLPSTFLAFDKAVAAGNSDLKEQSKTVAEAAAESRNAAGEKAKIRVVQDERGNLVFATK